MNAEMYTWTLKISIDPVWVADGFEVTAESMEDMIHRAIGFSHSSEVRVEILHAPSPVAIAVEQGTSLERAEQDHGAANDLPWQVVEEDGSVVHVAGTRRAARNWAEASQRNGLASGRVTIRRRTPTATAP